MPEKKETADYEVIRESIREAEKTYESIRDGLRKSVTEQYGLKHEILETILQYKKEDINEKDIEDLRTFVTQYNMTAEAEFTDEEVRKTLTDVKVMSDVIWSAKVNLDNIKKDAADILKEYAAYGASNKEKVSIEATLENLRNAEALEDNFLNKKDLQKKIYILEQCLSLEFVTERLHDLGKKELESINEGFFKFNRGTYVIDRFKKKIEKIGFNESLYYNYFNLEETFLPEKYHPFNNLFLFIYMRMVAYADVYDVKDVKWMKCLTGNFSRLFYHKFEKPEEESHFIEIIMKTLDFFADYKDLYENNNTTNPKHPARIEAERQRDAKQREVLIKKLEEYHITEYDPNDTIENLKKTLMENIDNMVEDQYPAEKDNDSGDSKVNVSEEEDGSVSITPRIAVTEKMNKIDTDVVYLTGLSVNNSIKDNYAYDISMAFFNTKEKRVDETRNFSVESNTEDRPFTKVIEKIEEVVKEFNQKIVFVIERNENGLALIDRLLNASSLKEYVYYNNGRLPQFASDNEDLSRKIYGCTMSKSLKSAFDPLISEEYKKTLDDLISDDLILKMWLPSYIMPTYVYYFGNNIGLYGIIRDKTVETPVENAKEKSEEKPAKVNTSHDESDEYDCNSEEEDYDDENYE